MSDLILKQLKEPKNSSRTYSTYNNDVITVNDFLVGETWMSDINSSNVNKINAWVNVHMWRWFVSPIILFCSLILFVMAPKRIFEVTLHGSFFRNVTANLKRGLDILLALIGVILSSIFFLILPVLIKLDSRGPIFYSQLRVGHNRRRQNRRNLIVATSANRRNGNRRATDLYGRSFNIYKFRTMREDAEKKCGPVWASDNDPRITAVGRLLRRTHLDELPQLFNILKGDMSFVGPRPERHFFVDQLAVKIPQYTDRLNVKPGLTGLAQIKTGYDVSIESVKEKLSYDLEYCQNGNLKSYFKIMFITMFKSVLGKIKI
jgi:lipopolysaccharide/colanic/teichoic acid biosynthesis glycosyltransferase